MSLASRGPEVRVGRALHPGERGDLLQSEVVVAVDRDHAGHGGGFGDVDAFDARVRHRRADEHDMEQARDRQVVEVAGLATQDRGVLDAAYGLADEWGLGGGHCRIIW